MRTWSIYHPIGISLIALACVVLGAVTLPRLGLDLLPHIIYPEVRVRVLDSGVPAVIMEEQITRQLEEQLAITEGLVHIQSRTSQGRSAVDLSFPYGWDIDKALADASIRLDRAKRFLPDTISPPVIYKRDPSQLPVAELVLSSNLRGAVALRDWADNQFARWLLNLPGVAAVETGGGLRREIQVIPDLSRLQALGLSIADVLDSLQSENLEAPLGRLHTPGQVISVRLSGRALALQDLAKIPLQTGDNPVHLGDVAQLNDGHEEEQLRIRLNGEAGVKLSIQKQPRANTVAVADALHQRLDWLKHQQIIPEDIQIAVVGDQSVYVRQSLQNTAWAVLGGALLAMLVVYLFLGDVRRTLIIGSSIPIALMLTFALMGLGDLHLNIMTLGGLAVGVGLLVDSAIVMLENIARHQQQNTAKAAEIATQEISSAIFASTSTNLAAILPFLFISGLIGLLFRDLILTLVAAMLAAMVVALTLVPALSAKVSAANKAGKAIQAGRLFSALTGLHQWLLHQVLRWPYLMILVFLLGLVWAVSVLQNKPQRFLPNMDEGRVQISVRAEPGIPLARMDAAVTKLENLLLADPQVISLYAQVGGFVFGRSQYQATHRSSLKLQLQAGKSGRWHSQHWIGKTRKAIKALQLVGIQVYLRSRGIRGIRLSQGDDDISLRLQGPQLDTLKQLAQQHVKHLKALPQLRNLSHSQEDTRQELVLKVDRLAAAALGFSLEQIRDGVDVLLRGKQVGYLMQNDQQINIRVRLLKKDLNTPQALSEILLYNKSGQAVYLDELAHLEWQTAMAQIQRDQQQRIVEISGSLAAGSSLEQAFAAIENHMMQHPLPAGYSYYDGGEIKNLQTGRKLGMLLLGLAIFLVFVVMAVQYESLRNPLVILLGIPFALIGVAGGLFMLDVPLSMPVWLGLILLAGLVVNNSIVLVETIEQQRCQATVIEAILTAARLRLRPVLMTTLTTVAGMIPLALGWGAGTALLQPLAITVVFGLSFSLLVSLLLIPALYALFHQYTLNVAKK
ncbi:efflux RND transporter permease subunit [Candidatus Venteria ishoeyi]|uniref:Multidrug resistance protein MdtB n=1 Tax=Candidatus Venteria ishoeyi TaxID=1899563 RepID=A0A1H6FCG9_9GAMM|nr:efflux RND transporter permease subunit [Candidatus Venteria ishoeyi]SEH07782.1 Multidrug resistance protein MdtB [Candidatus Venteria ishoeyi]